MPEINLHIKMVHDEPPMVCKFKCDKLTQCLSIVRKHAQNFYNEAYHQTIIDDESQGQPPQNQDENEHGRKVYFINSAETSVIDPGLSNLIQSNFIQILQANDKSNEENDIQEEANLVSSYIIEIISQIDFEMGIANSYVQSSWNQLAQQLAQSNEVRLASEIVPSLDQSSIFREIKSKSKK